MTFSQLTSVSFLDRLQTSQDERDWKSFLRIYQPFIRLHLVRAGISDSDANDLTQDSLTAIFQALPKFSHNGQAGAFRKWMRTLVVRLAIRFLDNRHRSPKLFPDFEQIAESIQNTFEDSWEREHDDYVVKQLLKLIQVEFTMTTWSAFELQVVGGYSANEVAQRLGCSANAVLLCKSRVMRRLRQAGRGMIEC